MKSWPAAWLGLITRGRRRTYHLTWYQLRTTLWSLTKRWVAGSSTGNPEIPYLAHNMTNMTTRSWRSLFCPLWPTSQSLVSRSHVTKCLSSTELLQDDSLGENYNLSPMVAGKDPSSPSWKSRGKTSQCTPWNVKTRNRTGTLLLWVKGSVHPEAQTQMLKQSTVKRQWSYCIISYAWNAYALNMP